MRRFRHYYKTKLTDAEFCDLYAEECHVCACTVKIFEKMTAQNQRVEDLAKIAASSPAAIQSLVNADYCDPHLVVRLCQALDVTPPNDCQRMQKEPRHLR